jgi:glycosyltransferase involved in cell wall biosynthesis
VTTAPPRVGINLLWLVPGVVGGSEISSVTTLQALADAPPGDLEHVLFVLEPFVAQYPQLADAFETHSVGLSGALKGARVGIEQSWLPARARRLGIDAMHHMGGTSTLIGGPPSVVSIHDLQPFDLPANFNPVKRAWLSLAVPRSVRRSRLVLTPSEWVRGTVIDRFGVDPDRVRSVPHGLPELDRGTPEDELRRRYDLRGDVVLYPTITYPHKDHVTLVRAFSRAAHGRDATLVLTGRPAGAEDDVEQAIAASGAAQRIRRTGSIPRADVAGLVDFAAVVAVPSLYEGFGLPVLEAMARGAAVVVSDATALPEVVGDGGVIVAAGDVDAWAAVLSDLLDEPLRRTALGEAGRRRAADFSPRSNLASTLAAHRDVLGRGPDPSSRPATGDK